MTTNIPIDLTATNAGTITPQNVMVVAAVNVDGSSIGSGSGTGTSSVNINQIGGTAVSLGAKTSAASIPVVLANDTANLSTNINQVGGVSVTLGQKTSSAGLPVALASDQLPVISAFAFVAGSTQTISATTTSANTVLSAAASGALQIINTGTVVAFVAIGANTQTATTAAFPVMPGATIVVSGGGATNVAAIVPSGTATLYVSRGTGL